MSATQRFRIAAIPADGVGLEVVAAGREVLDALAAGSGGAFAFDWQEFGWGCEYYARTGRMMAEDGLAVLRDFDAIYFGAVGWPGVPDHVSLPEQATRLHTAIEATTAAGILTRDLGGTASTADVAKALIGALDA
jgi:isocitrate/isopropylmalate dehydrogenase